MILTQFIKHTIAYRSDQIGKQFWEIFSSRRIFKPQNLKIFESSYSIQKMCHTKCVLYKCLFEEYIVADQITLIRVRKTAKVYFETSCICIMRITSSNRKRIRIVNMLYCNIMINETAFYICRIKLVLHLKQKLHVCLCNILWQQ